MQPVDDHSPLGDGEYLISSGDFSIIDKYENTNLKVPSKGIELQKWCGTWMDVNKAEEKKTYTKLTVAICF